MPDRSFETARAGGEEVRAWVLEQAFPDGVPAPGELLDEIFALRPSRWLRRLGDRETFPWPGREAWIVKRTRGGEARDWWHETLRGGARSPARCEAENLVALGEQGIRVPRPLLWVEETRACRHPRRGGRSALVMEHLGCRAGGTSRPDAVDLRLRLRTCSDGERRRLGALLVRLVSRFHALGWIHRDLYLQHVLCSDVGDAAGGPGSMEEELHLIDLGRARSRDRTHGERWLVKDLAALAFTAPDTVTRAERLRFLLRWLEAIAGEQRARDRAERRRWIRLVLRKARRIGAHRPRALDPADPADAELFLRPREP